MFVVIQVDIVGVLALIFHRADGAPRNFIESTLYYSVDEPIGISNSLNRFIVKSYFAPSLLLREQFVELHV